MVRYALGKLESALHQRGDATKRLPADGGSAHPDVVVLTSAGVAMNPGLDMMAENRFNVLTLWSLHSFHYMVRPKSFLEASPFTEAELGGKFNRLPVPTNSKEPFSWSSLTPAVQRDIAISRKPLGENQKDSATKP